MRPSVCLLAFAASLALAADAATTDDSTSATSATAATSDSSSSASTAASTKSDSSASSSATATSSDASSTTGASSSTTGGSSTKGASSTSSASVAHLSGLPTIAGASIPTIVIPYTADAPFMQKSSLPEGTMFICIGAILGFLGFCVLAWRAMIAYTINRSVKRAALASIMASDAKAPAWFAGGTPMKKGPGGKMYKQPTDASSLSLENLTANGKKLDSHRVSVAPTRKEQKRDPSGLFFSPTAPGLAMSNAPHMAGMGSNPGARNSTYLPAGYYASPAAQATAGAANSNLGGPAPSYSRTNAPESPSARPASTHLRAPSSKDPSRNRASWAANTPNRNSAPLLTPTYNPGGSQPLYAQPSTSSLAVGVGNGDENLPGSRAPSAYFDDLLHEHGNGPRERF